MSENNKDNTGLPQDGRRTEYIGAKVTAEQKRHIRQLAGKCGMTVSDYLLARAFGYKPKERLTERQTAIMETLVGCRSDLVNYTSALRGMNMEKRRQMFGSYPFMLGWLKELGKLAERITGVLDRVRMDNLLQPGLDATGIWESMKLAASGSPRVRNTVIRIELSPAPEHTKDFSLADWRKLWDEFVDEFDGIELLDKNGKTYSPKTNLKGSKGTVWLHEESDSGIPHLHGAYCRIDEDGRINNDHDIHLRAQRAAERVALKRGWTTARQVRETNIGQVNRDCMEVLQSMDSWSWNEYTARLRDKGYEILELRDGKKVLHGYALVKGNSSYKASKLGKGRNLTASRIEATWKKLHHARPVPQNTPAAKPGTPVMAKPSARRHSYASYKPGTVSYDLNVQGKDFRFYIPEEAAEVFNDEFDYRGTANHKELTDMAVALFVGLMDTPVVPSSGGEGSNDESPWGRKKDEDDREWARRCARMAARCMGRKPKSGYKR